MSKNDYTILINAGALDEFNLNYHTLISNLDEFINYGNLYHDLGEYALIPDIKKYEEISLDILRNNELNSYGIFISNHPSSKYNDKNIMKLCKMKDYLFKNIVCYVMVEDVKRIKTKKGEDMAFLLASDETGAADFTLFPKNYHLLQNISKNDMIKVWGNVSKRFDKYSIIINNMTKE